MNNNTLWLQLIDFYQTTHKNIFSQIKSLKKFSQLSQTGSYCLKGVLLVYYLKEYEENIEQH